MSEKATNSEKLYAVILRLYPARFRRQYGEEAMRVLRERLRDERGIAARLRLWIDLLLDAGSSLPREYRRGAAALSVAPAAPHGVPLFRTLETELPKPGSFFGGTVMAFLAVAGLGFLLNHAGRVRHFAVSYAAPQAHAAAPQSAGMLPTGQGPGGAGSPAASAGRASSGTVLPQQASASQAAGTETSAKMAPAFNFDDAARRRVIAAVAATLRASYPSARKAELIAAALAADEDRGVFQALSGPDAFADAVTQQMRDSSGDSGLVLYFVATPLPKTPAGGDIHWIDAHFLLRVPLAQPAPRSAASHT